MALKSIREVYAGFFGEFTKGSTSEYLPSGSMKQHPLQLLDSGNKALIRYFQRSGEKGLEEVAGYYPCVVIQDFAPTIDTSLVFSREYIDGYFEPITGQAEKVYLPVPMEFTFQVSAVADTFGDKIALYDWMMNRFNFTRNKSFEFNKVETPDGLFNADIVGYKVSVSNTDREDGRFEYTYNFTLNAFIHYRSKATVLDTDIDTGDTFVNNENYADAVAQIKISLYNKDFITFERVLTKEFIIK
jgi:hypothetical protein